MTFRHRVTFRVCLETQYQLTGLKCILQHSTTACSDVTMYKEKFEFYLAFVDLFITNKITKPIKTITCSKCAFNKILKCRRRKTVITTVWFYSKLQKLFFLFSRWVPFTIDSFYYCSRHGKLNVHLKKKKKAIHTIQKQRLPSPLEILLAHQKQFNIYPGHLYCEFAIIQCHSCLLYI